MPPGQMEKTGIEVGPGSDPYAPAVARLVRSIVEYSRWPDNPRSLSLCIVGTASHAKDISDAVLTDGRRIEPRHLVADRLDPSSCKIVYIGEMSLSAMRNINERVRGKAVLTIAEDDPGCRSRSMFCIRYFPRSISFGMNIDSISRSGVRVDPRVLRLTTVEEGA